MSRLPQALLAAILVAPWLLVHVRDRQAASDLQAVREATARIGEILTAIDLARHADPPPHGCPRTLTGARAEFTPPLVVDCTRGPGGRCRPLPTADPTSAPGSYPASLWDATPVWRALGFRIREDHVYHYALQIADSGDRCVIEIVASASGQGARAPTIRARAHPAPGEPIEPMWEFDGLRGRP